MSEFHLSQAEFAKDLAAILEKVRQGAEVVIEDNHNPIAVLRPAAPPRRTITQVLALMPEHSTAVMDPEFAADVRSAIESHREPLEPPA